jgi:hypothetical protein
VIESVRRKMRNTRNLRAFIIASLVLLGGVIALPAAAAAPTNTFPGGAAYIDNHSHTIPANTGLWYRFDYTGRRTPILLTLVNGTNSGLEFGVYTPAQISDWWETPPIGRGTPPPLNCETMKPGLYGGCQGRDLRWSGDFNALSTYYVRVFNHTGSDLSMQLTIQGSGVLLGGQIQAEPTVTASPMPTAVPSVTPPPAGGGPVTNTDPDHANVLDNQMHSIAAHSSLWYRFRYAGDRSQITITLLYAANSGLAFNVYTPAQISDWWEAKPIGRGTIEILDCETNQPDYMGGCQSDYLRWIGKFNAAGLYYVELVNNNSTPMTARFTIVGDGVSPG